VKGESRGELVALPLDCQAVFESSLLSPSPDVLREGWLSDELKVKSLIKGLLVSAALCVDCSNLSRCPASILVSLGPACRLRRGRSLKPGNARSLSASFFARQTRAPILVGGSRRRG
jgi:hypothetical protein